MTVPSEVFYGLILVALFAALYYYVERCNRVEYYPEEVPGCAYCGRPLHLVTWSDYCSPQCAIDAERE